MRPENPFFTLEMRRRSRQWRVDTLPLLGAISSSLPAIAALTGAVVESAALRWGQIAWNITCQPSFLFLLVLMIVVGVCASQVLTEERRRGTLDDLRLLPLSATRWLFWKAQFPLFLIGLLVGSTFPGLFLAGVLAIVPVQAALQTWLFYLAFALYWGAVTVSGVLAESFYAPTPQRRHQPADHWKKVARDFGWFFPRLVLGFLVPTVAGVTGLLDSHGNLLVFRSRLPLEWVVVAALAMACLTAFAATREALSETEEVEWWAARMRWLVFAMEAALVLGILIRLPSLRWLSLLLLLPLASFLPFGTAVRRRERPNRWQEAELAWLEARWPNPIFLHDLRRHLGSNSLRGAVLKGALSLVVLAGLIFFLYGSSTTRSDLLRTLFGLGLFQLFLSSGYTLPALQRWTQELGSGMLPLLMLSPLRSSEWMTGRIAAGIVCHLCGYWTILVLGTGGMIWLIRTPYWIFLGPGLFAFVTLLVLRSISFGLPGIRFSDPEQAARQEKEKNLHSYFFMTMLFIAGGLIRLVYGEPLTPRPGETALALSLLCLPLPFLVLRGFFRQAVVNLEQVRCGEAEWDTRLLPAKK